MLKTRIILLIAAAAMIILIFNLPKVVVDNNNNELGSSTEASSAPSSSQTNSLHSEQLPEDVQKNIENLSEKYTASKNIEKSVIFADSLAHMYLAVSKYDSAAKFFDIVATNVPDPENWVRAGNAYYEAFSYAMDANKRTFMASKAREYFDKVLDQSPERLDLKNKLAMTYLSSSNPMQGIVMLREILEVDPENEKALFNLGALSMQSNQYDKAVERFSQLVGLYPENTQARFFLGVSYLEIGNKEKAKEQFKKVKELDDDPEVQATVDSYLEDIK